MISCRPFAMNTAPQVVSPAGMVVEAAAWMALTIATAGQGRKRHAEHDDERREEHLVAASCDLQEDAQRDEHERGEKLVGRAEERPDIRVADLGEQEAERQRESRREIRVAKELAPRLGMRHIIHGEELLEAHAADSCHRVEARERQRGTHMVMKTVAA